MGPIITVQPLTQGVELGSPVTLSVTATGTGTLHYQWKLGISNVGSDQHTYPIGSFSGAERGSYTVAITDDVGTTVSDPAILSTRPAISVQPTTQAVEIGGTLTLVVVADGYLPLNYQWYQGVDPVGANSNILTVNPYMDSDRGSYTVVVSSDGNTVTSSAAIITTQPVITVQPTTQSVGIGSALSLTVTATGHSPLTYQWKKGDVNVGTDSDTFTIPTYADTDRGTYSVDITSDGNDVTSDLVTITTRPVITVQPTNQDAIESGSLTFSVTATGHAPISYQWKKSGSNVGTNSSSYTINPYSDTNNGSYTVDVTCDGNTVTSNTVTATTLPNITVQPITHSVIIGGTLSLSVTATGHSALTYQWYKGVTLLVGQTSNSLSISPYADSNSGSYTVTVSCDGNTVTSSAAVITTEPAITTQPMSQAVILGGILTLNVVATGGTLSYQWYDGATPVGTNSSTYTVNPYNASYNGSYTVAVSCEGNTVTSSAAIVTTLPSITTQPVTTPVLIGGSVTLSVVATGDAPITYQWYKNSTILAGQTASTLVYGTYADANRGVYYVAVTCDGNTVNSANATLSTLPYISVQPANTAAVIGSPASLSVTATGHPTLTYQWYHGAVLLVGEISSTLSISTYDNSWRGSYTVMVTSDGNTITSSAAVLSTQPAIITQPVAHATEFTLPATMSVVATGYNTTYQWYFGVSPIIGQTTSTLTIADFENANRGSYTCQVTSDSITVTTTAAILTCKPLITQFPINEAALIGDSVEFSLVATGKAPITYQWYKDSVLIVSATSQIYKINHVTEDDYGTYTCAITCAD